MDTSQEKTTPASAAPTEDSTSPEGLLIPFGSIRFDEIYGPNTKETRDTDVTCPPRNLIRFQNPAPSDLAGGGNGGSNHQDQSIGSEETQNANASCRPRNLIGLGNVAPYHPQRNRDANLGLRRPFPRAGFNNRRPGFLEPERIMELAADRDGSDYLKREYLSSGNQENIRMIFEGVINNIFQFMSGPHGCRVFTRLIDVCSTSQQEHITGLITWRHQEFIIASLNQYGSSSICWLIRKIDTPTLVNALVAPICSAFFLLMTDRNGVEVVLKCAEVLPEQYSEFLYRTAIEECVKVACQEWGSFSLERFIDQMEGLLRDELMHKIAYYSRFLSQDRYGNYVVQKVLEVADPFIIVTMCSQLTGYYVYLAMNEVGSHVVQKCLESQGMNLVVDELIQGNQLMQLNEDQYGCYVVQTALRETFGRSPGRNRELVRKLRPNP